MVCLGRRLKNPKTCEKPYYNNITVVLCKKMLQKTQNIGEMKIGHLAKAIAHAKAMVFAKWLVLDKT